jgi:hypothetical protein
MSQVWSESKHYQLENGKWVPHVHLFEIGANGLTVMPLYAPEGRVFETEEEARRCSDAMAKRWIDDRSF